MKEDIFVLATILLLMFLFLGEPDVWDALIESTRKWLLK